MSRLERTLNAGGRLPVDRYATRNAPSNQHSAAPDTGLQLTLSHYRELLGQNLRLLVTLTLVAALFGGAYALYKLNFSPVYRASATVTLQPTDAELRFTQGYVRASPFNSANVVSRSHIEYLRSRELAARVYTILRQRNDAGLEDASAQAGEPAWLAAAKSVKRWLQATLVWMNSGSPVGAPAEGSPEDVIAEIQEAISLDMIEASFVMQINVDWEDPQTAAEIANTLASVFEQRSREQIADATQELTAFLEQQKFQSESRLESLLHERKSVRAESGVVDLAAQRLELLSRLFRENEQRDAERRERNSLLAKLDAFQSTEPGRRLDGVSREMQAELNRDKLREVVLGQAIVEREQLAARIKDEIAEISLQEARFESLNSAIERTLAQLEDIDARLLNVQMNEASGGDPLRVIDTADVPILPEEPKVLTQTGFSGVAGLILAVLFVIGRSMVDPNVRTNAELAEIRGCKVLGPTKLGRTRSNGKARLTDAEFRPYLGWYEFDTDLPVAVLDMKHEDRATAIGRTVMDHHPYSDNVVVGLAPLARQPGYLDDCAAVIITLGRDEVTPDDLRETVQTITSRYPSAAIALTYVDRPWRRSGRRT